MPIRAQIGPPRYILPVQAMGARFPERMIHHSLVRDLVMRHLISEWAPKPATRARGNGVRWSERQPENIRQGSVACWPLRCPRDSHFANRLADWLTIPTHAELRGMTCQIPMLSLAYLLNELQQRSRR